MNQNQNTNLCTTCNNSPCLWSIYRDDILNEVNEWIPVLSDEDSVPDKGTVRYMCKLTYLRLHTGIVFPNSAIVRRFNLPSCVRNGICELVADNNNWPSIQDNVNQS